jgi:hypothetical protein
MDLKWQLLLFTTLIPLLFAFIWYHPTFLGRFWRTPDVGFPNLTGGSGVKKIFIFLISGFMLSIFLIPVVIHQMGFRASLQSPELMTEGSEVYEYAKNYMEKYGTNFRTFKHGVLHGFMSALFCVLPVLVVVSLIQSTPLRKVFVHAGYFVVILSLMGGVICAFI